MPSGGLKGSEGMSHRQCVVMTALCKYYADFLLQSRAVDICRSGRPGAGSNGKTSQAASTTISVDTRILDQGSRLQVLALGRTPPVTQVISCTLFHTH